MPVIHDYEVKTQDFLAGLYADKRYANPASLRYHKWWVRRMAAMVKNRGRILDNGCGTGICYLCEDELRPMYGLDVSLEMLKHSAGAGFPVVCGDSQQLPFADGSFSTVVARGLLHHLPDPDAGAAEIARVLEPGGELIASDTNQNVLSGFLRAKMKGTDHFSEDHKDFTLREVLGILRRHMKVDRVEFLGHIGYPLFAFPDLIDFTRLMPMSRLLSVPFIALDSFLSKIPVVREQGWVVLVRCVKKG